MASLSDRKQQAKVFGRNVQRLRRRAGLTQELLAEKADLSPRYVQNIEQGNRLPSVYIAEALRKALKATWTELL